MPAAERQQYIQMLREFPAQFAALVRSFTDEQLDLRVADTEWSTRQIVHHVADSHMNAVGRFKLPLTEDHPTLPTYDQDAYARLADYSMPIEISLSILPGLHARFVALLESLTEEQWTRTCFHPERGEMTVEDVAKMYANHGVNHINQINAIREKYGF